MKSKSEIVDVQGLPFVAGFNWSTGFLMQRFIEELANRKILGAKCPDCGYTYVPPRSRCGKCYAKIEQKNLITLSGKGTLVGYTTAYVELDGKGNFGDLKEPGIIGAIKLENADSTIFMPLEGIKPRDVTEGLKVEVQWREETKGELADIKCFRLAR
ncbi:MAG TPA: Zn-ribbon domain-containing OB-fold protein [Dehalococcoidia bacterium]|nr:Zn-ribbon domain-containing OB-fold protein [Dehalococcoidia bacterium]